MSNQDTQESADVPRYKSGVVEAESASGRAQGFQKDAKVKMKVTENKITQMKSFTIAAASQRDNKSWQYQLKTIDGLLWDGATWFPEVDIKPRK
ncbi:hypothetical protein IQ06DRAFT_291358 [Phaeosphaeriaceae sp. SRC1lsM3a]|nr:hypothetical protein IQ06DRAFT_291358 [Stagonospora sp. SRC1lsM3a]